VKIRETTTVRARSGHRLGFTLVDALIAVAVAGVMFGGLYAGIAFGFNTIKFARENTRATQIMLEKMEIIRLYTWDQITTPSFVSTNTFLVSYYSVGGTNIATSLLYTGAVSIADAPLTTSYSNNVKMVTVTLNWCTGSTPRTRSMSTYVARNGMQSYVW
jgi:Tfp pilus assembly protein PilV